MLSLGRIVTDDGVSVLTREISLLLPVQVAWPRLDGTKMIVRMNIWESQSAVMQARILLKSSAGGMEAKILTIVTGNTLQDRQPSLPLYGEATIITDAPGARGHYAATRRLQKRSHMAAIGRTVEQERKMEERTAFPLRIL
ncbi:hypothetical protein IFR05_010942 [Cadophora sp. M221]|nr:hypothetical protein IFR05_010942 [Cadophora sp. M221]